MNSKLLRKLAPLAVAALVVSTALVGVGLRGPQRAAAQAVVPTSTPAAETLPPTPFRVGEKLTYTISFGPFRDMGFAEISVVSRGRLEGRDAVELSARFKTNDIVSAALFLVDETRTTFAAADSGLPLYVKRVSDAGVAPAVATKKYIGAGGPNLDLLTLIQRLRDAGGSGTFLMDEDDRTYVVTAQPTTGAGRVKTDAGEFDTTTSTVQSDFFTLKGIQDLRVSFSTDESRVPVQIRFKTSKGEAVALLQSVARTVVEPRPTPTAAPTVTPKPVATPTPKPTPAPQPENLPLSATLPFVLGETLEYRVTTGGRAVGTVTLRARQRRFEEGRDSLFISAVVTNADGAAGVFSLGDGMTARVDPEALAPYQADAKFTGLMSALNSSVRIDQDRGLAVFAGGQQQVPLNTHSLLSLVYAMRAFNLKPSKDQKNPVNDTRVSVFYNNQAYIFTLRPLESETITVGGVKMTGQKVTIITGVPALDMQALRVWLSTDDRRVPLRLAFGAYQADLASATVVPPK